MDSIDQAIASFREGFNCSQAVLSAYGPQLGLDREAALRVAGPFGGGIGRMGDTCGAVVGALMVIGLKHSATKADDQEAKLRTCEVARELVAQFRARNGSILCRDLLGHDLGGPSRLEPAQERELFLARCPKFLRDAGEIIEQLLG